MTAAQHHIHSESSASHSATRPGGLRRAMWMVVACGLLIAVGAVRADEPVIQRHPCAVQREACFPLEELSAEERALSETLLLDALDSEALYTFVGGIKPVSEGFFSTRFRVEPPELVELERVRAALRAWRCGEQYSVGAMVFEHLQDGERFVSGWIASRPHLAELVNARSESFGRLGLTKDSDPEVILLSVERAQDAGERWRGFGLLFGYPEFAVDFFVRAGRHQQETGEFIERDFRQYPTFGRESGNFVYAVPQLTDEKDIECDMRRRVERVQAAYRPLREQHIGKGKAGVVALLREWFDDGTGSCHPDHAWQKAKAVELTETQPAEVTRSPESKE